MSATITKSSSREHYEKYEALAQAAGIDRLRALVPDYGAHLTPAGVSHAERLCRCLTADQHLNNIPIRLWDLASGVCSGSYHGRHDGDPIGKRSWCPGEPHRVGGGAIAILDEAVKAGRITDRKSFSQSECVSLLKHVATYHIAGASFVEEVRS